MRASALACASRGDARHIGGAQERVVRLAGARTARHLLPSLVPASAGANLASMKRDAHQRAPRAVLAGAEATLDRAGRLGSGGEPSTRCVRDECSRLQGRDVRATAAPSRADQDTCSRSNGGGPPLAARLSHGTVTAPGATVNPGPHPNRRSEAET